MINQSIEWNRHMGIGSRSPEERDPKFLSIGNR